MCVSDPSATAGDELFDMSGNVKEWVLTTTTTTGPFEMRGGAYNTPSFTVNGTTTAPGLQCDAIDARPGDRPGAAPFGRIPLLQDRNAAQLSAEARSASHEN